MNLRTLSRRRFLQVGVQSLASGALMSGLGLPGRTWANTATVDTQGYKALVCVFLLGGNDGFNMIVPAEGNAYTDYAQARSSLALSPADLIALNTPASDGQIYGFDAGCPELAGLFESGNLAVLSNVGTLIQPTTAAQARAGSVALPPQLFSHVDQQTAWMTGIPQSLDRIGWAGRIADALIAQGTQPRLAFNLDMGGANYWQSGRTTIPYVLGTGTAPQYNETSNTGYRNGLRAQASAGLLSLAQGDANVFVREYAAIRQNAADKVALVNSALAAAGDFATPFPAASPGDSDLIGQLHEVARVIKAQAEIGDARQMFFVSLGGFDTHQNQLNVQRPLLSYLSRYLEVFWQAMNEIGLQDSVTVFTASDFGRSLSSNGDGADHGWGSHQLVLGGAVRGGRFYGQMPSWKIDGPDDYGAGRIVPSSSVDQYAATLAQWLGVDSSALTTLFPNLDQFSSPNLGFMA